MSEAKRKAPQKSVRVGLSSDAIASQTENAVTTLSEIDTLQIIDNVQSDRKDASVKTAKATENETKVEAKQSVSTENTNRFMRGEKASLKPLKRKSTKKKLQHAEKTLAESLEFNQDTELLLPSEAGFLEAGEGSKTADVTQDDLVQEVGVRDAVKRFDLNLESGPYMIDYTRNGKYVAFAGNKGQVAIIDWTTASPVVEYDVQDTAYDIKFLLNYKMHAVAQSKYTYIYDHTGAEVHCLRDHVQPRSLEFLPYHMLLVSASQKGRLVYQDVSTGSLVAKIRTQLGSSSVLVQNPYNAVMCMGHGNGVVSMWTPNSSIPAVKIQAHRGPISSIAIDSHGRNMVTSSHDGTMKFWDIRSFKPIYSSITGKAMKSMHISQRGLLAVGHHNTIDVFKNVFVEKQKQPYMKHSLGRSMVADLHFVPFEDVLGIGHAKGMSSILIPGAGEPNFDSFESNPFQTKKQLREDEVHKLLDKLSPDMITLDPNIIGTVSRKDEVRRSRIDLMKERNKGSEPRNRAKGRNSIKTRLAKKKAVIIDHEKAKKREQAEKARQEREDQRREEKLEFVVPSLKRFKRSSE
eukprot:TRINITY_DN5814_c0_g1_i2.p1 TRINITY_DN5814_c0_g1~~TRINITY_DN5814_c0_g1_i2.p1  ORF type:complete len:576 (+),score=109.77 TRINITY_DN5814_c0_g1_i2:75-1802(+)